MATRGQAYELARWSEAVGRFVMRELPDELQPPASECLVPLVSLLSVPPDVGDAPVNHSTVSSLAEMRVALTNLREVTLKAGEFKADLIAGLDGAINRVDSAIPMFEAAANLAASEGEVGMGGDVTLQGGLGMVATMGDGYGVFTQGGFVEVIEQAVRRVQDQLSAGMGWAVAVDPAQRNHVTVVLGPFAREDLGRQVDPNYNKATE